MPLARVKSCATEYEPAVATAVVSSSSARLERDGKGCEWAFAVCLWPMNIRGHLFGKQSQLHRTKLVTVEGNCGQLGSIESFVRRSALHRGGRDGLFFFENGWSMVE